MNAIIKKIIIVAFLLPVMVVISYAADAPEVDKSMSSSQIDQYLLFGGLPQVVTSHMPGEELHAYVSTYLQEEIQAESLVRKVASFSRFLSVAALTNGQILNFAKISSDTQIPASTVREYYRILEDTLIGFSVPVWKKSIKRKSTSTAKFYFFDVGVRNAILGIEHIDRQTDMYGQAFEHFIAMELRAFIAYSRKRAALSFWQTATHKEVDFLIGDEIAIEVKSSDMIQKKHLKNLQLLMEESICKRYFCVCFDYNHRIENGIEIMHWQLFLEQLWQGHVI